MINQVQTQQITEVMIAMTTIAIMTIGFRMIDKLILEPQSGRLGNPGHAFIKRTKRGSLSVVTEGNEKAILEITNHEDMEDIARLLTGLGIKFDMTPGISKPAWEGAPTHLRGPRPLRVEPGNRRAYPGWTVEFDFKELQRVMSSIASLGAGKPQSGQLISSPKFRVEQTTVDKVIDDLERTWHRIDSDMSIRMQEALGILKHVMAYYYEEKAIVVWDNSNLVGIAAYRTIIDRDMGVQDTHILELASFTYEPGVGKLLIGKVINVAKEEDSDAVTASHAPGAREFYEKLGFVRDYRNPAAPTLMMYDLKSSNPGELPTPVISEIQGNITARIEGIRAVAELSALRPSDLPLYGLDPDNWLWFNRLINQSGIPRVGSLLLDAALNYCEEKDYSILNQVNAYGDISQKELEGWYIRKGFTPVDYGKYGNALLKWTPPQTNPSSVKLYHCTDESNVDGIMRNGLLSSESASGMLFFFPNLEVAEEAGLSGMAILEVSITDDEVDKCIIGETFPDLYIGRYGGEPPADTTLREYIRNPIAYGIPEVCCTISKIPADRIKYVKTIRR